MKTILQVIPSLFILLMLTACGKPVKSVLGNWMWVETTGGLLPPRTPGNTGESARLSLTRDYWTYYENGVQVERYRIDIKRRTRGLIIAAENSNDNKIIEFLSDDEITITYDGGPNTDCQDYSVNRFVRISED